MRGKRKQADQEQPEAFAESGQDPPRDDVESREAGQQAGAVEDDGRAGDECEVLRAELAEWKDRCLRMAAEMENVRRRARMEAEEARRYANERLVLDLLPVLDNLTRALEVARQSPNPEALLQGVEAIHRQLSDVLAAAGVERIEAEGKPFDPNVHEAIMQVPCRDGDVPNQVVEELRAGYRMNDRVLRPALVKVTSA